jgi:hypothetical protein
MRSISEYVARLNKATVPVNPEYYGVYEKSVREKDNYTVFMGRVAGKGVRLCAFGTHPFVGLDRDGYTECELSHTNAGILRREFPFCAPKPVLSSCKCTFGVGDRLGRATPGHLRVFERYDVTPVLVQQSMRELSLTKRTFESIMDDVTFFVFREGYEGGFGADGDHLKNPKDIGDALEAGFTMITVDLSEHIHKISGAVPAASAELKERYLGKTFTLGDGTELMFREEELDMISAIYTEAMDFTAGIYQTYFAEGKSEAELEISIDETEVSTTPLQHFFVANELTERGVKFATIAPRFSGEFQKGIDYIGDIDVFTKELRVHHTIAETFGYKLSVHSGSDKYSVFPIIGEVTGGHFHIKTSGTNWLEAMRLVAMEKPVLYRNIHKYALAVFDKACAYYHVSANPAAIPDVDTLRDDELPMLFDMNDSRQLIHITYGFILGHPIFRPALDALWTKEHYWYEALLRELLTKHMECLQIPFLS